MRSRFEGLFIVLAIVSGMAGLIVSIVGVVQAKGQKLEGLGLGIAGIAISLSTAILACLVMVVGLMASVISLDDFHFGRTYDGHRERTGAFDLVCDRGVRNRTAMIWNWYWDGDPEHTVIEIPEESNGVKIRSIGERAGADTRAFRVKLDEGFDGAFLTGVLKEVDGIPYKTEEGVENDHVKNLVFTVKVGKNIDEDIITTKTYYKLQNKDGSVVYYQVVLYYEVDPENPKFYSSEGKLFYKDTDKEVSMKNP